MRRKAPRSNHSDAYPIFTPTDWPGETFSERYLAWRRARLAHLQDNGVPHSIALVLADCHRQRRSIAYPPT